MNMIEIRPMQPADLHAVSEIDHQIFSTPWPKGSFAVELMNSQSTFLVAHHRYRPAPRTPRQRLVVGYIGYWLVVDEAQIATLGVHPDWRQKRIGSHLLESALCHAREQGAIKATLEVRQSNYSALALYTKFGFCQVGERKGYYFDNGETALLLTADPISCATGK